MVRFALSVLMLLQGCSTQLTVLQEPDAAVDSAADMAAADTAMVDSVVDVESDATSSCAVADPQTLALYPFEASAPLADSTGNGHTLAGTNEAYGASDIGCDEVAICPANPQQYFQVPASLLTIFDQVRSLRLLARFQAGTGRRTLLSADAVLPPVAGHHLSLWRTCDDAIVFRIQSPTQTAIQCSAPVPDNQWIEIIANFGPGGVELYTEGTLATRTDRVKVLNGPICEDEPTSAFDCGTSITDTLTITEPMLIGAGTHQSNTGSTMPLTDGPGAELDHVTFSSVPRTP